MKTGTDSNSQENLLKIRERSVSTTEKVIDTEFDCIIGMLADRRSIPSLINLLDDKESCIRWIAAESLIRIGRSSLLPLLRSIKSGRQFKFPAKPYYVLQRLLNKQEKIEMNSVLLCLERSESFPCNNTEISLLKFD